ncbi:response regulator transcription factor [Paraclostridium bifermentans]|uniref:response regulator transcription factor n=1 Tax=Paraclostridium bifermentans TaxID=1490 RepID=UPI00359C5B4C
MFNILIVEDEIKIAEVVKAYLDKEGYNTKIAYDGHSAINMFNKNIYDVVLLDLMLPDISGEEVCKKIRDISEVPIIMVTAKIEDEYRIEGFNMGCDDYICKPFNMKELILRVKAILKRTNRDKDKNDFINLSDILTINTKTREVIVYEKIVELTNTEYKILLTLANSPKRIFTREELMEYALDEHYDKIDRVIDAHIKNLRQKIEKDTRKPQIVQTVYGVGYKIDL